MTASIRRDGEACSPRTTPSMTEHSHSELELISADDMRPNALRPVTQLNPDVLPCPDETKVFAIDHSGPGEEPDWRLYRRVGERDDWSDKFQRRMTHHLLEDSSGRYWRISFRAWGELKREGWIQRAHLDSSFAQYLAEQVERGKYDWSSALSILETIEPGDEPEETLQEHVEKNRPMVGGGA